MLTAWLPALACVALIFTLSSMSTLTPPGDVTHLDKLGHLFEYGLLGILMVRGWRWSASRRLVWIPLTLGSTWGVAALDEWFQGTTGRFTSLADWGADAFAVTAVILILLAVRKA